MPTVWGEITGPRMIRVYAKYGETLEEMRAGERLRIKIEKDRNGKFSSLYHLMLGKLAKAINRGPAATDIDALKRWVKLKRGWYSTVELPQPTMDGLTHAIEYKSTSFKAMGEEEFGRFALDTCELIQAELAPWVSDAPEWAEVKAIIATISPEVTE